MQAAREVAQLVDRRLGLHVGGDDEVADVLALGQPPLGEAELHGERDQPLLRTVVQIALQPAALRVGRGDDARPGVLQRGDARGHLGIGRGAEQRARDGDVERDQAPHGEQEEQPDAARRAA